MQLLTQYPNEIEEIIRQKREDGFLLAFADVSKGGNCLFHYHLFFVSRWGVGAIVSALTNSRGKLHAEDIKTVHISRREIQSLSEAMERAWKEAAA